MCNSESWISLSLSLSTVHGKYKERHVHDMKRAFLYIIFDGSCKIIQYYEDIQMKVKQSRQYVYNVHIILDGPLYIESEVLGRRPSL